MKHIITRLTSILLCVLLLFSAIPTAQAAAMRASVVTAPVTLDGLPFDNRYAKYPLLLYSNVTYFPMTYRLCRFLGVTTDWDDATRTLRVGLAEERGAYAPETGSTKNRGSVAVTPVTDAIFVNNAPIDNAAELYPLFRYRDVIYFPLSWDFAREAFGWFLQWDAENGLRVECAEGWPGQISPDNLLGNHALLDTLERFNRQYVAGGTYRGTLTGPEGTSEFTAALTLTQELDAYAAALTGEALPFYPNNTGIRARFANEFGGLSNLYEYVTFSGGALTGDRASAESVYIGRCFLDCQFCGKRVRKITAHTLPYRDADGYSVWDLTVSYEDYASDLTDYTATITVDNTGGDKRIVKTVIQTPNYTLTMQPV